MKLYTLIYIFLIINVSLYSEPYNLGQILPDISVEERMTILSGTSINRASKSSSNRKLLFLSKVKHAHSIQEYIEETNPTILYEILLFIPNDELQKTIDSIKTQQFAVVSNPQQIYSQQSIVMIHYYNLLRDISHFDEIEYINFKDKNVHPLFKSSDRIISKEDRTFLSVLSPLRSFSYITVQESAVVLQDMPPFGDVVSQYNYVYNEDALSFIGKNLTYISYYGFAAVRPENMFITSQIVRTDKGVLVYGLGSVRISGLGVFFGDVISNSFTSRMVGFFDWVNSQ